MSNKIAIVEECESTRCLLDVLFYNQGFKTAQFTDAREFLSEMELHTPSIVILADAMSEGPGVPEAIHQIRKSTSSHTVPVIVLAQSNSEQDKIIGLDAGASDYVTKPFGVLELCARVRAQLRRVERLSDAMSASDTQLSELLSVNTTAHEVRVYGQLVDLTSKEKKLLKLLFDNQDRVLTRSEIFYHVWGKDCITGDRTLNVHVGTLRKKLQNVIGCDWQIITVHKVGYRLVMTT